jgi:translocator protein
MNRTLTAIIAISAVAAAQASGRRWSPTPDHPRTARWYASLRKPSFTPPGPVFGVAWTALDALLAYNGYRLLGAPSGRSRTAALGLWIANVAGVAGFSYVLFGRKRLDEATGVTLGMAVTALGAVAASAPVDRKAALACLPLAAWVSFAALLQEEVWRRNS